MRHHSAHPPTTYKQSARILVVPDIDGKGEEKTRTAYIAVCGIVSCFLRIERTISPVYIHQHHQCPSGRYLVQPPVDLFTFLRLRMTPTVHKAKEVSPYAGR